LVGDVDIGAAWNNVARKAASISCIKLDDPSFPTPIFVSLFGNEDGRTLTLI
jgi:uncharacterized protein (DUF736 family)